MKHLLIIISILLLSSPVIGDNHKGETLYLWNLSLQTDPKFQWEGIGEYVWKGFGEKDTNPKYQGEVENGVPNGLGFIIYPDGIWKGGDKYVGEWIHRWKNGQGTFTWSDGEEYVGSWKNGTRWNGTFYDKNGNIIYKYVNGR
jgi:hypothetical protein